MTDIISLPAINPANLNSLEGLLEEFKNIIFNELEKVSPCEVVSYDRSKNRAIVKISIYDITTNGDKIDRSNLYDIPVFSFGGGGIFMNFPLNVGNTGWIVSSDKDISIFKQNLSVSSPNTFLRHRYDQAFFIPDKINLSISSDDENAFVLTTTTNNTKITLKEGTIKIKGTNINIDGTTTTTNNITSSGTITGAKLVDNSGASGTIIDSMGKSLAVVENGIITTIM